MAAAQRNGDSNDGGGVINSIPQSTVFVNSKAIARVDDSCDLGGAITEGSSTVFAG